jgi:hypothetical protein
VDPWRPDATRPAQIEAETHVAAVPPVTRRRRGDRRAELRERFESRIPEISARVAELSSARPAATLSRPFEMTDDS